MNGAIAEGILVVAQRDSRGSGPRSHLLGSRRGHPPLANTAPTEFAREYTLAAVRLIEAATIPAPSLVRVVLWFILSS